MIFINCAYKEDILPLEFAEGFLKLLNPVAPHITEEFKKISIALRYRVFSHPVF